jgi:hypothetical protein
VSPPFIVTNFEAALERVLHGVVGLIPSFESLPVTQPGAAPASHAHT